MTETDYGDWTVYHMTLFGMNSAEDRELFRAWKPVLVIHDPAQLRVASLWIAANSSDRWRTQHLRLLLERLRVQDADAARKRLLAAEAEIERRERASRCGECRGRGLVDVPHPAQVRDGEWVPSGQTYYLVVVTCRCPLGEARHQALRGAFERRAADAQANNRRALRPDLLSVLDYELHNPNWPRQLEDREWARQARQKAEEHSRYVDKLRGPLAWIEGRRSGWPPARRRAAGSDFQRG
jgi:hypothetical protein